jgi:uncharacterized RDD family membrane protein YckC
VSETTPPTPGPPGPPQGFPPPPPGYAPAPGYGAPPPGYAPPPPGYAPPPPGYPPPPPGYPAQYGQVTPYQTQAGIHPYGRLATPGRRFVGYLLYIVLFIVTLGIGYIIWDLISWKKGQTPVYRIMKMQVVKKDTGQPADFGTMFVRGFLGSILQGLVDAIVIGYILLFMPFWDKDNQMLWDKISGTVVLDTRPVTA